MGHLNDEFYRQQHARRVIFAPNSVDNERFASPPQIGRSDLLARWGLKDNAPVIIFCGKLISRKRPMDLIEALRILSHEYVVLFVGDGVLANRVRAAIKPGRGRSQVSSIKRNCLLIITQQTFSCSLAKSKPGDSSSTKAWLRELCLWSRTGSGPPPTWSTVLARSTRAGISRAWPRALTRALIGDEDTPVPGDCSEACSALQPGPDRGGFEEAVFAAHKAGSRLDHRSRDISARRIVVRVRRTPSTIRPLACPFGPESSGSLSNRPESSQGRSALIHGCHASNAFEVSIVRAPVRRPDHRSTCDLGLQQPSRTLTAGVTARLWSG